MVDCHVAVVVEVWLMGNAGDNFKEGLGFGDGVCNEVGGWVSDCGWLKCWALFSEGAIMVFDCLGGWGHQSVQLCKSYINTVRFSYRTT